jgi:hypothetical protein
MFLEDTFTNITSEEFYPVIWHNKSLQNVLQITSEFTFQKACKIMSLAILNIRENSESCLLSGTTGKRKENHKNSPSEYQACRPRFEPWNSWLRSKMFGWDKTRKLWVPKDFNYTGLFDVYGTPEMFIHEISTGPRHKQLHMPSYQSLEANAEILLSVLYVQ